MSYRDPGQIQADRSGEIFGQAIAGFGQQVLSFAKSYADQRELAAKQQKAENDRIQRIAYQIEEKAYENANKNYTALQKQSPGLAEQFGPMVTDLLNGKDGKMGAIEAQTILATRSNLTQEDKKYYRDIVQRAKLFQDRVLAGGADIIADLQDLEKIKPQDIGNTHYYAGDNTKEKLTSQYSAYVLSNKEIPGAQTSKNLSVDDKGNPIVSVSTTFDVNSDAGKNLLKDFPELESEVRDGKISFNWEKDIMQLGDGFIRQIPEGLDATQVYQDTGAMTKDGKFTQNMMVGSPVMKRVASGAKGIDNLVEMQYINTPALMQSQTFNAAARAKATAIISYEPGDVKAYMQNTLQLGPNYDYSGFIKKPADEKIRIIQELEKERLIKTKLASYKSRPATAEDVQYINSNAKNIQSGESIAPIKEGEMIYYQETSKGVSEYTGDRESKPTVFQQKIMNAIPTYNMVNRIAELPPMSPVQLADRLTEAAAGDKSFITGQEYVRRALAKEDNVTQEMIEETAKKQGIKLDYIYDANDNTKVFNPANTREYKQRLYALYDLKPEIIAGIQSFSAVGDSIFQ